ncbi:hypothetical protein PENSUB_10055 [Penicillium subrubescens]|uniref:Uncharacterized protein n=1 Tax=Penicillium subrubescens TaxID=1316194 RepID=A0A1Q5TAQ6_9EURO|nr:hypothetical protein PENSUB_10055 [Penicillium subrubescens]
MEALGHSVDSNVLWRTTTLRKNEIEVYYHATGNICIWAGSLFNVRYTKKAEDAMVGRLTGLGNA